jgi:hypothetical protein
MAQIKKTYKAPGTGLMTLGLNIKGTYTPIVFSEGKTYPVKLSGTYTTDKVDVQEAIEKTRQFKTGRITLVSSVEIRAKKSFPESGDDGPEAFVPKYSKKTNFKTVKTLQDAADLLLDKLGEGYPEINEPTRYVAIAEKNNMYFPNIEL